MNRLNLLERLPAQLLDVPATELWRHLPGPTLVRVAGMREPPLFASVLQHGNETSGWDAARAVLDEYRTRPLPRSLWLFIGNVQAARYGRRHLPGQVDYNRAWPGGANEQSPEGRIAAEVAEVVTREGLFAAVDIHNNSGRNPHYGCINMLDPRAFRLARLFGSVVVYVTRPRGMQSMFFSRHCPAVTVECGRAEEPGSVAHARRYLQACLSLEAIADVPVPADELSLFHTVAVVTLAEDVELAFGDNPAAADICLPVDLERLNFRYLPAGTPFGRLGNASTALGLRVTDESGADVTAQWLSVDGGTIRLRRPLLPAMLTRNIEIIRQDCLCYFMAPMQSLRLDRSGSGQGL